MEKSSTSNIDNNTDGDRRLKRLDIALSITLKASLVIGLSSLAYTGHILYKQYAHYGPDCLQRQTSFQYWLEKNDKAKGKIVSIHKTKQQPVNGTTKCYGKFLKDNGSYTTWTGSITELSNKEVIGMANLDAY